MYPRRLYGLALLACASVGICAGCGASPGRACSAIGASSGVSVDLSGLPTAARAGHAEFCEDATCTEGDLTSQTVYLSVDDTSVQRTQTAEVRLVVTAPSTGAVLFDDSVRTALHQVTPNGPGCSPTVLQAGLAIDSAGRLVPAG